MASGKLKKENFGYSVPVNAPLYQPFPVYYRDAQVLSIDYETDLDAALALLPSRLEIEGPAVATAIFADYPWSTVGAYLEVAQVLKCKYEGRDVAYAVHFHVTTPAAMSAGREIAGFPKKMGEIGFDVDDFYSSYLDRPSGVRICSADFTPVKKIATLNDPMKKEWVSLRVIPNPLDPANPSLRELIGTEWNLGPGEVWGGVGHCHLTGASAHDPYHKLPVKEIVGSSLFLGSMAASGVTFLEEL